VDAGVVPETVTGPGQGPFDVPRWARVPLAGTLFALAVLLPLLRQQDVPNWRTIWAEDGAIYLNGVAYDGLGALFRGNDGYLQFVPRLLMAPAELVPMHLVSVYIAWTAAIVTAVLAAFVFRSTRGWIQTVPLRLLVAAFYVLAPAAGWETSGNFTNVIWPLLAAVPWALVSRRDGWFDIMLRVGVVVLAALSHPLTLMFVPLALLISWRRRGVGAIVVTASLTAALVAQAGFMLVAPERHEATSNSLGELYTTVSVNTLGSLLAGDRHLDDLWLRFGVTLGIVATFLTALVFFVLLARASRRSRQMALMLVIYAALVACGPLWSNGTSRTVPVEGRTLVPIQRYVTVPVMFLVGAAAVLVDPIDRTRRRPEARIGRPLLLAHSAFVVVAGFSVVNPASAGPSWQNEVERGRQECRAGAEEVGLDISPGSWFVVLPCDELS
jgi:hypothetical protein